MEKRLLCIYNLKRWVYLYDEQTFLTKVLKSPDLSIEEFFADNSNRGMGVRRECVSNEEILQAQLKQYHKYLVGEELEILNKRVHDSLIRSIKNDAQVLDKNPNKIVNFFDLFGEFMLYAGSDGLYWRKHFTTKQRNMTPSFYTVFQGFDMAFKYGAFQIPFWKFIYRFNI